jgi:hypothetical protein
MGPGIDVIGGFDGFTARESERVQQLLRSSISDMSLTEFHKRLIVHFEILFKMNKLFGQETNNPKVPLSY